MAEPIVASYNAEMRKDVEGATFSLRHIEIATNDADGRQQGVVSLCIGPLAVSQARSGEWVLTHLASGRKIESFDWWDDAATAAARLVNEDWSAETLSDPARLKALGATVRAVKDAVARESLLAMIDDKEVPS